MNKITEQISSVKKTRMWLAVVALMAISFVAGLSLSANKQDKSEQQIAYSPEARSIQNASSFNFNLYWEVWNRLKSDYVDKNLIKDEDMFYGSLRGLASSMEDPYTIFMDPAEAKEFADDLSGTFEGIGAEVGMRDDIVTVIAPLSGMPAEKAGLRSGDKIYAIDDVSTLGLSIDQAVKKIRGPKDTEVKLTIIRESEDKPLDITITRGLIVVKSVKTNLRKDGIFVITVSNFNDDTMDLFNTAIKEILTKNPKGIVLDLRNNPGGYLDTAIAMASAWVKEGPVVVEQFGEGRREEYFANGNNSLGQFKTVILINGGSASASEIVAGALRDYHKASLVGEQSYGKGSVQSLRDLSDGSTLKVTVAKWLTPAGDFIDEKGIIPEYEVKLNKEDVDNERDPQMEKAVELILKKDTNNKK
ncbi:S41 family peptidase [Patescibacteria group bacterium]|nr:S41 family peptidase [Patescibacteria group bacterium]